MQGYGGLCRREEQFKVHALVDEETVEGSQDGVGIW